MPNSLLSRFDLLFLILDKVDTERDLALSRHVLQVHRYLKGSKDMEALTPAASISSVRLPANVIKKYISWAREVCGEKVHETVWCEPHAGCVGGANGQSTGRTVHRGSLCSAEVQLSLQSVS